MNMNIKLAHSAGFTLIELMIVIVLVAILSIVALPSYNNLIKNNCLTVKNNSLVSNLQIARSEAIKRSQDVTITRKSNDWSKGWTITGANGDIIRDISLDSCANTTITNTSNSYSYLPSGSINSSGFVNGKTEFVICDDRTGENGRVLKLNFVGRPNTLANYTCS